jgi:mRNA interferase RelE/StbE
MEYLVEKNFLKDLQRLPKEVKKSVADFFHVQNINGFNEIQGLEKLTGFKIYYRYRIGDYRVGIAFRNETIIFLRVLHRREIYRNFP